MPDASMFAVFLITTLVLLVMPGPAVLYIIARSIDQGRTAGIVSVLGVGVGTLFHVVAAALGLSALLLSSALAFNVVKYLGAAYLVYLGIRTLLAKEPSLDVRLPRPQKLSRIFSQGVLVNLLNPKVALFFFAFLPQFVDPARGSVALQVLLLGMTFVILGILSDGGYALLAGTVGQWLRGKRGFLRGQRYFAGGVYLSLGITTALTGAKHT